jgi:hypothetical protein
MLTRNTNLTAIYSRQYTIFMNPLQVIIGKKGQKIITEIMVSELNVLQCNKFHHHVSLAICASALVCGQPRCKNDAKAWVKEKKKKGKRGEERCHRGLKKTITQLRQYGDWDNSWMSGCLGFHSL